MWTQLGPFLRKPHLRQVWSTNATETVLYRRRMQDFEEIHDVFTPQAMARPTRFGQRYEWTRTQLGGAPMDYYASVCHVNEMTVTYHSKAAAPTSEPKSTRFWDVLRSFENQSLWRHLSCDGDGEWIHRGMLMGSLCIVHDGSYMVDLDTEVCSAGVMIICTSSGQTLKAKYSAE